MWVNAKLWEKPSLVVWEGLTVTQQKMGKGGLAKCFGDKEGYERKEQANTVAKNVLQSLLQ